MNKKKRQELDQVAYDGTPINAAGMSEKRKRGIISRIAAGAYAAREALGTIETLERMLRAVKADKNVFMLHGDCWVIQYGGRLLPPILGYKGLLYIHDALQNPGRAFSYGELDRKYTLRNPPDARRADAAKAEIEGVNDKGDATGQAGFTVHGTGQTGMQSNRAEFDLLEKAKERLRGKLEAARANGDIQDVARFEDQLSDIENKWREHYGTRRRPKRQGRKEDPTARAVRKALQDAIRKVHESSKPLAEYLDKNVIRENGTARYIGRIKWVTE